MMVPSEKSKIVSLGIAGMALFLSALQAHCAPEEHMLIGSFDYNGLRLLESRCCTQFQSERDFYLSVSDHEILRSYRKAAGLAAPGRPLGGWCSRNIDTIFGQCLTGMGCIYRAC